MSAAETLDRYFQALRDHDWKALGECVSPEVHRTGPYGDVVTGREAYVAFLSETLPKLQSYELRVHRVDAVVGGSAWVRLSEWLDVDGRHTEHPEALHFAFDGEARISRVDIYLKRLPRPA